jgi:lipid II:glycine glycyltransferase (peptidoglycan interpeptide bridge formation enzyme)
MREKFIRRQIRRGETAGISVRKASQDEFMKLYRRFRTGSGLPKERMAEALAHGMAFAAGTGEEVLAVGLFLGDGTHARAHVLASVRFSNTGSRRELVGYANRVLIWHVMRELKRGGYHELDLGGIAPDSANAHQRSLAEFKEAFGGERRAFYYYRKTYSPLLRAWRRLTSLI